METNSGTNTYTFIDTNEIVGGTHSLLHCNECEFGSNYISDNFIPILVFIIILVCIVYKVIVKGNN